MTAKVMANKYQKWALPVKCQILKSIDDAPLLPEDDYWPTVDEGEKHEIIYSEESIVKYPERIRELNDECGQPTDSDYILKFELQSDKSLPKFPLGMATVSHLFFKTFVSILVHLAPFIISFSFIASQ